jgi:hypothetical protein
LQWARRIADREGHLSCPGGLPSLKLLIEDAQLETKRSNEGDPNQSEASE